MNIDWSKAPEGTTGAMVAQWNHRHGLGHVEFIPSPGHRHFYSEGHDAWRYVERPTMEQQSWDGAGLPPVGAVCEVSIRGGNWHPCAIRLHEDGYCLWRLTDQSEPVFGGHQVDECEFRPIRTPEQIAEEERQRVVSDMMETAHAASGFGQNRVDYEALYDAGYRKQEVAQ